MGGKDSSFCEQKEAKKLYPFGFYQARGLVAIVGMGIVVLAEESVGPSLRSG